MNVKKFDYFGLYPAKDFSTTEFAEGKFENFFGICIQYIGTNMGIC